MKKQVFNPYMPSWEYVPDGEPHVFGDRVYVYGSHDLFNGWVFCLGDYVCYSAPVDDLTDWRYEGVIYPKTSDPYNKDGSMCLYAPDVTQGTDGRYYLYYVLDHIDVVSVAVCDEPAGKYEFYGYVHYPDGTLYGRNKAAGDEPQFDPAVITEGDRTYLYTGFCGRGDKSRHGAMATVLDSDMLTVLENPKIIVPGGAYGEGTEYEGHAFFEAPSIRKFNDTYYFVYSSEVMHELCYAVSDKPTEGFKYGGVLVSNCDMHIDTYKPADKRVAYAANNHGGLVFANGEYYIFYHRHTNGTWYSRQGCAEKTKMEEDGSFRQVEITSCGLNGGPLVGKGYYPAYIACHIFAERGAPKITQDGRDGDEEEGYAAGIGNSAVLGFKYFEFDGSAEKISIWTRGYGGGEFEIRTAWDGEILAKIRVRNANIWTEFSAPISLPKGTYPLYITFSGGGNVSLKGFEIC